MTRVFFVLTIVIVGLSRPSGAAAESQSPWFGTWAQNVAKSTYIAGPAPYKRATCRIEPWKDGVRVVYDLVYPRGGVTHLEWTGQFDGRDQQVQGLDAVLTNAYSRVDDRTLKIVVKADDRVVAVSTSTLSADGRTISTVTPDNTAENHSTRVLYERVP